MKVKVFYEEFLWVDSCLSDAFSVQGPSVYIPDVMVASTIQQGKAAGPIGIVVEMLEAGGYYFLPQLG